MTLIDEFTWKIILTCKNYNPEYLRTFFKKELNLYQEVLDHVIYYYLLETVFKTFDKGSIRRIFHSDLYLLSQDNLYQKSKKNFDYEDLWKLLHKNITHLQIKNNGNDIFTINVNNTIMTYDEYNEYINQKDKAKQLKK